MNLFNLHTLNKGVLSDLNEVCLDFFHLTTFYYTFIGEINIGIQSWPR